MAARPRSEHVAYVRPEGKAWIGFWYIYSEDGRRLQKRRRIGDRKSLSKTEAKDRHMQWVRENVPAYGQEPERPTVRQLWERHISGIAKKVTESKRAIHWQRTLHSLWGLLGDLQDREAATVTGDEVEATFDRLAESYSPSSLRKTRALLAQLLRGHSSAVADAQMRFRSDPKERVLSLAEVRALRGQLAGLDLLILDVYLFLGLSAMEGWRLELRHVGAKCLWIPGTKTDRRAAELPVVDDLAARLNELVTARREAGASDSRKLLFDDASHRPWLEKVLKPAGERAGIKAITMLDLRRTYGSMLSRHSDPGTAARGMRNSTEVAMKHYIGGEDAGLKAAMEAMAASIREVVN